MTTKAYVIVTNLPPTFKGNNFFYKLLKQQIPGGLLGAVIEDESTIGLAIFDTPQSALAACKEHIKFKGQKKEDGSVDVYDAKLRIVETEHQARAVESVYVDHLFVEGEKVMKGNIDFTYGLQLALKGEQGAAWCHHTRNKEACPLSVKCKFIHLREYQTNRKRLRGGGEGGGAAGGGAIASEDANVAPSLLAGMPFLPPQLASFTVTPKVAEALLQRDASSSEASNDNEREAALKEIATQLVSSSSASSSSSLHQLATAFLRIESQFGGTTDLDYFTEAEDGIAFLRQEAMCALPPNGCPTPAERDAFMREMLKRRNMASHLLAKQILSKHTSNTTDQNMDANTTVAVLVDRLRHFIKSPNVRKQLSPSTLSATPIRIVLQPRYDLTINPAIQELTFFMKNNIVVAVTQHYDDVLAPEGIFENKESKQLNANIVSTAVGGAAVGKGADVGEEKAFILEKAREVRGKLEQWAAKHHKGASSFSAAIHVAFPAGRLLTDAASTNIITPTPNAILFNEAIVDKVEEYGGGDGNSPIVLGAKAFESAAAQSSLFNSNASHDTRSATRPLWRRLRASPTPMFSRTIIDKFATNQQ